MLLRDPGGQLTLEDVRASAGWVRPANGKALNLPYDPAAHWLRVPLTNTSRKAEQWILILESTRWDELDWHILREGGKTEHHSAGNARSGPPGSLHYLRPNILVTLASGETAWLYLRARTEARGSLRLIVEPLATAQPGLTSHIYLLSFGACGILCVLGLILFAYGRHWGSLAYTVSTALVIPFYMGLSGFAKLADLPASRFLAMEGGHLLAELALLTNLIYIQSFFTLSTTQPRANRLWLLLLVISLLALPLSLLLPYYPFFRFLNIQTTLHSAFCFIVALIAWKKGSSFARFYLLSWIFIWPALTLDHLAGENLLSLNVYQDHLVAAGLVFSQLCIFLSLADRMRATIRDHEKAQVELLASLEEKVRHRTADLAAAMERAEKANRFKDLFLANIGHELRTPLSALVGLSQVMVRKGSERGLPPDFLKLLEKIRSGGNHLGLMLTNLLDAGAASHGKIPLRVQPLDLAEWARSQRHILEALADERRVILNWEQSFPPPEVFHSDPVRLSQILINLVHNCLKFSPTGGTVHTALTLRDDLLTIDIRDQGEGLPEAPETLFQLFEQNKAGLSDNEHGAGLGLHIVKTSLDLLGGTIQARNHHDGGAHFHVQISSRHP